MAAGQNWAYSANNPGSMTYGGGTQAIAWRDSLDAVRSAQGVIPEAQYPDGAGHA